MSFLRRYFLILARDKRKSAFWGFRNYPAGSFGYAMSELILSFGNLYREISRTFK